MFFVFLSILLFFIVIYNWGIIFIYLFFGKKNNLINPGLVFFLGFGFLSLITSFFSFFIKINLSILFFSLFFSLLGISVFVKKRTWNVLFEGFFFKEKIFFLFLLLFSLLSIVVFLVGKGFPAAGDTTGYHMGVVSWLNSFSLVPGLANLHFRLGNYSSYLYVSALFDNYIWDNKTPFIMPGVSFFAFVFYFLYDFFHFFKKYKKSCSVIIWEFFYFLLVLWFSFDYYFTTYNSAPNLYYDLFPMFIGVIMVSEIIKFFLSSSLVDKNGGLIDFLFVVNFLSLIAYLAKQSIAPIVLFIAIMSFYLLKKNKLLTRKNLSKIFFFLIIGVLFNIGSNIITSGYLFFPFPFLKTNFPWTISVQTVFEAYNSVRYWAKLPGENFMSVGDNSFLYWFIPWLKRNMADKNFFNLAFLPFLFGLFLWVINIYLCFKKGLRYYWLFIGLILNFLFWFLMAPDIRFNVLFFPVFFSSALAIFFLFLFEKYPFLSNLVLNKYGLYIFSLFFIIFSIKIFSDADFLNNFNRSLKNFYNVEFIDSNSFSGSEIKTKDGKKIIIYRPRNDNECRSFLPCAPLYLNLENIKAFDSNNLGEGFYFDEVN